MNIPDNYVEHTLATTKSLPPVTASNLLSNLNWTNVVIIGMTNLLAVLAPFLVPLQYKTLAFSIFWYYITGMGITAGKSQTHTLFGLMLTSKF